MKMTVTGRANSLPSLQNLPIRTAEGRRIAAALREHRLSDRTRTLLRDAIEQTDVAAFERRLTHLTGVTDDDQAHFHASYG